MAEEKPHSAHLVDDEEDEINTCQVCGQSAYDEEEDWDISWYSNWQDEEEDPDQVALVDEDGCVYATEDVIDEMDQQVSAEDEEYAAAVMSFVHARNALRNARIARGFYPIVVPANDGPPPRYGRGKGNGKGNGNPPKGKGRGTKAGTKAKPKPTAGTPSSGNGEQEAFSHLLPMRKARSPLYELHTSTLS